MYGHRLSLLCSVVLLISIASSENTIPKSKLPSAVVVGTVYCDTCFHQDFSKSSHFISGASVAVECGARDAKTSFREVAKTNEHGEFKVHLPFSVSKHVKNIEGCSVRLINSSEPYCAVASTATSSSIRLKSIKDKTHIFSAGFFTFKPLKQPELCDQKPTVQKSKKPRKAFKTSSISDPNDPGFLPPIQDPPESGLQPLPELPHLPLLPQLPPQPNLPGPPLNPPEPGGDPKNAQREFFYPFPFPPNPLFPPPFLFPPITNPFQPPPSILPPFFPSPPASIFPPIFPSPPASSFPPIFPSPPASRFPPIFPSPPSPTLPPFLPFPPFSNLPPLIPGLTPSPPPPPPPFLPFPIPPFPFQPTPGFPGVPPASEESSP